MINVIDQSPYAEPVSVVVNDFCNHAGAEIEILTYSKLSWWADAHTYVNDDSEDLPTIICKCGFEEIQESEEY